MKKPIILFITVVLMIAALWSCGGVKKVITLATTTSTENSGLLAEINPVFEKKTGISVKVIALGTGAAIKTAEEGNADVILVHARSREDKFVADGFGINRKDVMHNDFIIIGPKNDPAGIKGIKNVNEAFMKISVSGSSFVSRGDDSGTHIKEQSLWKEAGIPLKEIKTEAVIKGKKRHIEYIRPEGDWYFSIGQGMGNTINFAFEKQAYTIADRGTFIAYQKKIDLIILLEGDSRLFNPYGIIAVNPKKHSHVNFKGAMKYINWIISKDTQRLIGDYMIDEEVLFFPDAIDLTK